MKEAEPPAGRSHKVGWCTQWSLVVQKFSIVSTLNTSVVSPFFFWEGGGTFWRRVVRVKVCVCVRSKEGEPGDVWNAVASSGSVTGRFAGSPEIPLSRRPIRGFWTCLARMNNFRILRQMTDQDCSSSTSHTEDDEEQEELEELEEDDKSKARTAPPAAVTLSGVSSTLRAVIRIKHKYQALKKRRQEMALAMAALPGAPARTSPKIFTFDGVPGLASCSPPRKKRKRKRRVLYPNRRRRKAPGQGHSPTEFCLYLLSAILFVQVYNAIENLDDHVIRYDLEGLEKTLRREVFGQLGAVEALMWHLKDFLSTYVHNRPLVVSLHGPSGVGKSHLGRLLAGHFRSVVGEPLVLQYFMLHHCRLEADAPRCAEQLVSLVSEAVELGEHEEKIPLFVLDEAEHMHGEILDALLGLLGSGQPNQFLNAIYVILSNLGHEHITKHLLHNVSNHDGQHRQLAQDLTPVLRRYLEGRHPLWAEVTIVPLGLLERSHVMECFMDEMSREGFYPNRAHMEQLAAEIQYYPAVGGREYSVTGCKQVVAKVNLL